MTEGGEACFNHTVESTWDEMEGAFCLATITRYILMINRHNWHWWFGEGKERRRGGERHYS